MKVTRRWAVAIVPLAALAALFRPARAADEPAVAGKAKDFLAKHCARCHAGGMDEGGLATILDPRRLAEKKLLVPGKSDASRIIKYVVSKKMPADTETKPTDEEIADLKAWVDAGAPAFGAEEAVAGQGERQDAIRADLAAIEKADRPFARYFTLGHLASAGRTADELAAYRNALSKLLNSLSWKKEIAAPQPIDPAKTIVRIDLRKYDWTPQTWQKVAALYPYAVIDGKGVAASCAQETGTDAFAIRADWFLESASRPPLYHDILALPATEPELEKLLDIDVLQGIVTNEARRAGSYTSGECDWNRAIERHPSKHGAYWKTYDFRDGDGVRDIYPNPLGPGKGERDFQNDGSEVLFRLPNGLQAYAIFDRKGARLDASPVGLCWNKEARAGSIRITNGVSCMSCHVRGVREHQDGVRGWYTGHAAIDATLFDKKLLANVTALYAERDEMLGLVEKDQKAYKDAVLATGAALPKKTTDPIGFLVLDYEKPLDRKLAAAELGVSGDALLAKLKDAPLAALAPLAQEGGTVTRAAFQKAFPEAVAALGLGKNVAHGELAPLREAPPVGIHRFETAVGDGILSIELDPSWAFEGRKDKGGLLLTKGDLLLRISGERLPLATPLADLDALLALEKERLAQRLRAIEKVEHPSLGACVAVRYEGTTPSVQGIDHITLRGSWLVRVSCQGEVGAFHAQKKEVDRVLSLARLELPSELDPVVRALPDKLAAAGFESDYKKALARAKAEGKLVFMFMKPSRSNFT